jgi:hypothetical protein
MNTYGEWSYRSTILDLGTRWSGSFRPQLLYPQGKSPRYPLDRRLGGPQSRSGRYGEEKNLAPAMKWKIQWPHRESNLPAWSSLKSAFFINAVLLILGRVSASAQQSPIFDVLMTATLALHCFRLEAQGANASPEDRSRHSFSNAVFFKNIKTIDKPQKAGNPECNTTSSELISFPSRRHTEVSHKAEQPIWWGVRNAWYSIHFGCLSRGSGFVPDSKGTAVADVAPH